MPAWGQSLALSVVGMRLRRLRYGGVHAAYLRRLMESQWLDAERLAILQTEALQRVVRAAGTVPFYRDRGLGPECHTLEALRDWPFVSKEDLQAPRDQVVSRMGRGRIEEVHTGGTTGKSLTIYCYPEALQRNFAFFARLLRWANLPSRPRMATFAGRVLMHPDRHRPPYWRRNLSANQLLLSSYHLSEANLAHYAHALALFRPDVIDAYPSSLEPVARYVLDTGGPRIRPRVVITSSETLQPEVRELFGTAFAAPVFDHYGAAEMAAFICQCEHGSYHVSPEFGIVEVLRGDRPAGPGELGEIVATGFLNELMPLIRYRTGDLAVPGEGPCPCGRAFPVIQRIVGRLDDVVTTPDGRRIGRLDPVFKAVTTLRAARIVQDRSDHVRVEVVVAGSLAERERVDLLHQLALRMGSGMAIEVFVVPDIPRTGSGKLRTVVNLVSGGSPGGLEGFWNDVDA
jgi:phenylacetate-CoA ligase